MAEILDTIRSELKENSDEHTKNTAQRFFKEKIKCYGIKTAIVRKISKNYFNGIKKLDKAEVFTLCEELFQSGYMEESFIACDWSHRVCTRCELEDITLFGRWIRDYISNWASCDTLCNHTVGSFIEKYPEKINELKAWAQSENRWMKRASAVSLIIPARQGRFLADIFEIAGLLLPDKDDMVQKGYGWLLKEASRLHQKEVFDYVVRNKKIMPRTALRYAIEL
ncbi:MAG: DNA alkylation repair protein, partial [bacterium]